MQRDVIMDKNLSFFHIKTSCVAVSHSFPQTVMLASFMC